MAMKLTCMLLIIVLCHVDSKLEQNQVSGFLTLLRHMIHSQGTNQETMIRTMGVATIGALLQKVGHLKFAKK